MHLKKLVSCRFCEEVVEWAFFTSHSGRSGLGCECLTGSFVKKVINSA